MSANNPTGENGRQQLNVVEDESVNQYWADFFGEKGCNFLGIEIEPEPKTKGIKFVSAKSRKFEKPGKDYLSIKMKALDKAAREKLDGTER